MKEEVDGYGSLLDPSLLKGLSEEEKKEALAAAAAAKRAEERAEQRALERAIREKEEQRRQQRLLEEEEQRQQQRQQRIATSGSQHDGIAVASTVVGGGVSAVVAPNNGGGRLVFVSKRKRLEESKNGQADDGNVKKGSIPERSVKTLHSMIHAATATTAAQTKSTSGTTSSSRNNGGQHPKTTTMTSGVPTLSEKEVARVRSTYLGKSAAAAATANSSSVPEDLSKNKKQRTSKKITFKFRWDNTDDTFDDDDPLYSGMMTTATAAAGGSHHPNRNGGGNHSNNYHQNSKKRGHPPSSSSSLLTSKKSSLAGEMARITAYTVQNKPIEKMTARDWRIFRENYEISVKGGKAPPPLRSFRESPSKDLPPLHPALLDALENAMHFKEPTPIQRQAITIGLQRRDLIGIAETGSGKTVAFGVPLCQYLLNLPPRVLDSVEQSGPLAICMAPTRELALQIEVELSKLLSRQRTIKTCAIVGGQPIQQQAQMLRKGIHILVGTPGRINDCIDMSYLVLNQCSYIVLDEADRMIDMGFAPQMETILDAMGGSLKSENEEETYRQEMEDLKNGSVARHRLTAMFSATMPLEVEKLAKKYLRHPAVISIGDQDSGKNARIKQRIIFLSSPSQKERALIDLLRDPRYLREKVLVFVNEKKHADGVGRIVERGANRECVVMHGGKSQEQREENLEKFRRGGVVMVATDVAGRGLDIPDVAHVINYDLPTRSIENYTHRIGRTGRAGKVGLATSLITDADEGIMAALKGYLESTGNDVPDRLARHPAANANVVRNLID